MIQWLNWRNGLALVAILIVSGTIIYSQYLSKKIAADETGKIKTWVNAQRTLMNSNDPTTITLASVISQENSAIPIIETNERDSITNYRNLDSNLVKKNPQYLSQKLSVFKRQHQRISLVMSERPLIANYYYYGESRLQQEVRYYPIVQLIIVTFFIVVVVVAQRSSYRSTQNQLWAGMAKETAHQLGTPVTSLQGWVEMLKETKDAHLLAPEIEKDVNRLLLITDRFGKIGSSPKLEWHNLVEQVSNMIEYMRKRAGGKVKFIMNANGKTAIPALISPPLFDWVIENLLKNGLDAMDGKGTIRVDVSETATHNIVEVADTGKGIARANLGKVFKPGFTTKKRGWGLGLTLTKRIVEQYHHGVIFIKHSELGKGTTFRIELKKENV